MWQALSKNARGSGARQYRESSNVIEAISDTIDSVVEKATPLETTSAETRANAMEALRKVGKTICLSEGSTLSHEVHKHFMSDTRLEDGMMAIVEDMEKQDIRAL